LFSAEWLWILSSDEAVQKLFERTERKGGYPVDGEHPLPDKFN
jgi:hypothetical protein